MSTSLKQPPTKIIPSRNAIRKLEIQAVASNSDQMTNTKEGEDSKVGTSTNKNSATSGILQTTGDAARSQFMQAVAEIIEKIAKDSEDRSVTQKRSEFQQEVGEKLSELVRFGPLYGEDSDSIQSAKGAAWNHIVQKSGPETERTYKLSVKNIEEGAMEIYDIPVKDKPQPEKFRQMMVRDGCFFLQLALHILGGGDLLKYPPNHPYFGEKVDSSIWIPHMFFMGNQIPYHVIQVLMNQTFFKDVISEGKRSRKWNCPDETDIAKMALYEMVVKPACSNMLLEQPSNILECLHNLFLGDQTHDSKDFKTKEVENLEAGTSDDNIKIPSAGELSKLRIKLAANKTSGIKNIRFRNRLYCAKIYLPVLKIRSHTKDILTSLVKHEQNLNESDRVVTAYIRFMRDLVRTPDDFKILRDKKIIHQAKGENLNPATIIRMFDDLVTIHNSNFTLNFRHIRQKITDYGGPPWRLISFILGVLAIIQTIFTVLSYIIPPK